MRRVWTATFASILILCVTGAGAAPQTAAFAVPADIPIGPADENAETSRGLTAIMDRSLAAYESLDHMHAEGVYVVASKEEDEGTSYLQAKVSIDFHSPDRIAVVSTSDFSGYNCSFIANGTTVTMADADSYVQIVQPSSLAAFSDSHREGEIYEDHSGAMAISSVAPMLVSENIRNIFFEGITRYIYEGEERAAGEECHRIRFVQENPDVIVILWIDKDSWLIRKTSFINSYNADYDMVESFEEGVNSTMSIMTWDELSTAAETVKDDTFAKGIPTGAKQVEETEQASRSSGDETGWWESMVAVAAKTSPEETTWSLSRTSGAIDLQLTEFAVLPNEILDFAEVRITESNRPLLAVATENGVISLCEADGSVETTVTVSEKISDFGITDTASSGPLVLTINENSSRISAHDLTGSLVWQYSYPHETIKWLTATTGTERAVYVMLSGGNGVRKLDESGKVLFANGNAGSYFSGINAAPEGVDRLTYAGMYELGILDKRLNGVSVFDTDEYVRSVLWDASDSTAPIVNVAITDDSDVLLQRRAENGEISWTTMIAPKADDLSGLGLKWARLRIDGSVQKYLIVLLSDGQVVIATVGGKVIYRGQVSANDALVKRNDGDVLRNIAVADLNQDGVDEIYTKLDTHLMRLTTP